MEQSRMKTLSLKTIAGLCAAASVLSIGAVAIAQDGQGPGPRGGRGAAMRNMDPAERGQRLHDELQITAAQEAAFQTWQAAMQPPAERPDRQALRNLTTPQRLDQELAMAAQRQAQMKVRADATKRFYNQLTAAQRTTMDNLPPMALAMDGPGGRGPGGPGRGPGGRRGPGGPGGGGGFDPNAGFGQPQSFNGQ